MELHLVSYELRKLSYLYPAVHGLTSEESVGLRKERDRSHSFLYCAKNICEYKVVPFIINFSRDYLIRFCTFKPEMALRYRGITFIYCSTLVLYRQFLQTIYFQDLVSHLNIVALSPVLQ